MVAKSLSIAGDGEADKAEGDRGSLSQQPEPSLAGEVNGSAGFAGATLAVTTDYLLGSSDGLLDLDLSRAHSRYCSAPNSHKLDDHISTCASTSTHRHRSASKERRFSIATSSSSEYLADLKEGRGRHNNLLSSSIDTNPSYITNQSWRQFRKTTERRANGLARSLAKTIEMSPKRLYFLLIAFSSIIITCLLVSIVISRSVGLEDTAESAQQSSSSASLPAARSLNLAEPIIEYEQRSIDVVDLLECGKTFAYIKVNLKAKVPKSSPIYKQQPGPVHQIESADEQIHSPTRYLSESVHNSPSNDHLNEGVKFVLINPDELGAVDQSSTATVAPISSADVADPESIVRLAGLSQDGNSRPRVSDKDKSISVLADRLSMESSEENSEMMRTSELLHGSQDEADPLDGLASDLQLEPSSLNRTLVDCFLVDTDKRHNQRIMLEDRHRNAARTRKVNVRKMIETIAECRKLTWASLPKAFSIKLPPLEQSKLLASSRVDQKESTLRDGSLRPMQSPQPNMIASLFEDWFRATREPPLMSGKQNEGPNKLNGSSRVSRQAPLLATEVVDRPTSQQAAPLDQSSYLNMGLSMMSGIVPNTLWCGLGDRASNYSELGIEYKVDTCCRAHDHCPVRMKPFSADYGLINWSMSTRSHCECDFDFDSCLKNVNTTLSNVIRNLYFRFVGLQCIDVEGRRMHKPEV